MIKINRTLSLPEDEIRFTYARSGGPGGQNVNKLSTKATLWFNVAESPTLTEEQKEKIIHRLGNRISKDGVLQVVSMQYRTQKANREDALRRFVFLLAGALVEKPRRRKTRIPRRAKEARLQNKKHRALVKASRTKKGWNE